MKKSLLVAPALGVLVLAAAGSVGGTVAWFSSNTAWDMQASTFAITKLDGVLSAVITAGTGTAKTSDKVITVEDDAHVANLLTHGSYDYATAGVFVKSGDDAYAKKTNWLAKAKAAPAQANNVYYAVSWTVAFTYAFPSDTTKVNLYFDYSASNGSSVTNTPGAGSEAKHTYKGFRLGMIGQSSAGGTTYKRVWIPSADAGDIPNYVKQSTTDENAGVAATYPTPTSDPTTMVVISANQDDIAEDQKGSKASAYCLGQFVTDAANKPQTLTYTFVAWFEGEDSNVVDASTLDTVSASLKFYTRQSND